MSWIPINKKNGQSRSIFPTLIHQIVHPRKSGAFYFLADDIVGTANIVIKNISTITMYTSNDIISYLTAMFKIEGKGASSYLLRRFPDGKYLRFRISNHGIFLQQWFNHNKAARINDNSIPRINEGYNLALTFSPTEDECKAKNVTFPLKIINKTSVKTAEGNNAKPQFTVNHICYLTWLLSKEDLENIVSALQECIINGSEYIEPLGDTSNKVLRWTVTSNLLPIRIQGASLKMTIRLAKEKTKSSTT